jgi:hypothetical protein
MYTFAVLALVALATVKVVDTLSDLLGAATMRLRSLLTFVVAIGGMWIIDFSMFSAYGLPVRNREIGVWATGFIVAGLTVAWRAMFGYLTAQRAETDETLERPHLHRAA